MGMRSSVKLIDEDKRQALKALEESEEFYLLTYSKNGTKAGHWNFEDYAKLMGCLVVASEWFKAEMLKRFKRS